MFRLTVILGTIVASCAASARGQPIVGHEFTGHVTHVSEFHGSVLKGAITVNTTVSGSFFFDAGVAGTGVYRGAPQAFSIDIGDGLLGWSSESFNFWDPWVLIRNDFPEVGDVFAFQAGQTLPANLVLPAGGALPTPAAITANVALVDPDSTVFSDTNLPTALDFAEFEHRSVVLRLGTPSGSGILLYALVEVTFDSLTPILTNTPPIAAASIVVNGEDVGQSAEVECDGPSGATVTLNGEGSSDPDGDDLEYEWSVAEDSGASIAHPGQAVTDATFPVGVHQATLTVYDLDGDGQRKGGMDVATVSIMVIDDTPPLVRVTTDIAALLPPNNKLVPVAICVEASDACTAPAELLLQCSITSSQPDDSDGTGELVGDVNGADGFLNAVPVTLEYLGNGLYGALIHLRAERDGADPAGRVYSVNLEVMDATGNTGQASTTVVVPHDRRRK